MTNQQHTITKSNLRDTKWVEAPVEDLPASQVRLSLDAFALTANNVTYAAIGGPPMNYWNFFPTTDAANGRVPVWGFATVQASNVADITPGQRVYGYFPISETLDVSPINVSPNGFMDGASHRQDLAPIYNTYTFTNNDPAYDPDFEAQQMLFRPLYLTGWMICDSITNGAPVPDTVIISSASSKTALATAHGLHARGIKTIGVTSPGNKDFVESTGLYSETILYDDAGSISAGGNCAYVDFVGRPDLTLAIHTASGDTLGRSLIIGVTDWEADRTPAENLPGPVPEFFFVPTYAAERAAELGGGELNRMMNTDLRAFYPASKAFVTPESVKGPEAIDQAWQDSLAATVKPTRGLICSF